MATTDLCKSKRYLCIFHCDFHSLWTILWVIRGIPFAHFICLNTKSKHFTKSFPSGVIYMVQTYQLHVLRSQRFWTTHIHLTFATSECDSGGRPTNQITLSGKHSNRRVYFFLICLFSPVLGWKSFDKFMALLLLLRQLQFYSPFSRGVTIPAKESFSKIWRD